MDIFKPLHGSALFQRGQTQVKNKHNKNSMQTLVSLSFAIVDGNFLKKEGKKLYKKQEKSGVQRELAGKLRRPVIYIYIYTIILLLAFNVQSALKAISRR